MPAEQDGLRVPIDLFSRCDMKTIVLATDGSDTAAAASASAIVLAAELVEKLVVVASWDLVYTPTGYTPVVQDWDRI
jgi:hypothetical protein